MSVVWDDDSDAQALVSAASASGFCDGCQSILDAVQDERVMLGLAADARTWRDIARAAIHQLHGERQAHAKTQERYQALLHERQAQRRQREGRAA